MKTYDENVQIEVIRDGQTLHVPFCEIKKGDKVFRNEPYFTCGEDAHKSGDASYEGWLVYDENGGDYYPEDFGALEKRARRNVEAVFIQHAADEGITLRDIRQMKDMADLDEDTEISILQVEGEFVYAVGIILDSVFERIAYNNRPDSPYCTAIRDVLNDVALEREDQTYDFCGIRTMITYS